MKKTLAILLVLAMIVAMVPAFTLSAAEGDTCTITEVKNQVDTLFGNIVDGKGEGWYYYQGTTAPDTNWKTSIPTGWTALKANEVFDNNLKGTIPSGYANVWVGVKDGVRQNLWAVRKVTLTSEQFANYKDKPMTTYMRHCNYIDVYINGNQVLDDPRNGADWTDYLTSFDLTKGGDRTTPITLGEAFATGKDEGTGENTYVMEGGNYVAYVAAYVQNTNNYWFDMSLEVLVQKTDNAHTEVTIANADQYIDFVTKVNASDIRLNGNVPVNVTVTGNLDFTGKTIATIGTLNNTTIDFGSDKGYTVSGIVYNNEKIAGNQAAVFATSAGNSTIKNLYLKDSTISADNDVSTDMAWFGILVGWSSNNVTIDNVTIDNVTLTHDGEDSALTRYCGVATLVGVSNNNLNVSNITIKNTTINAPATNASIVTARCGNEEGTTRNFNNIKVESLNVNALAFGSDADVASQLCYKAPEKITTYTNIDLSGVRITTLRASANCYSAYFQTRDGATTGTKDFRIIVVASEEYVNTMNELCGSIDFEVTFRNGTDSKAFNLKAQTVYSKVEATDAAGNKETYTAAAGCYVFGWVVKGVPVAYASQSGENMPILNIQLNSTKYTELELTYTKDSFYNSDNGNTALSGGNTTFYATQLLKKADLPAGTIITVDAGWQYRAERWNDENVRPAGMNRPDNTSTNIVVIDENWWGECTQLGINVSKNPQSAITDDNMPTTRLHIYVPVSE